MIERKERERFEKIEQERLAAEEAEREKQAWEYLPGFPTVEKLQKILKFTYLFSVFDKVRDSQKITCKGLSKK